MFREKNAEPHIAATRVRVTRGLPFIRAVKSYPNLDLLIDILCLQEHNLKKGDTQILSFSDYAHLEAADLPACIFVLNMAYSICTLSHSSQKRF